MPNFVWKAKDKYGRSVVREIIADTSGESQSILLAEGCTELALVQDEVMDAGIRGFQNNVRFLGEEVKVTAQARVKHMGRPAATFVSVLRQGIGQSKSLILVLLVLAAFEAYRGNIISTLLMLLALMAWVVFLIFVGLPSIYYGKLHKAADWHRWAEVLELVRKLAVLGRFSFIKLPPPELGRYRAKALAGQGQLSEALTEYSAYENQPGCPSWLYKSFVAGIYDSAKQHDQALEWTWRSIEENARPTIYLDLANRYARFKKNPAKAREALSEAEKSPIIEVAVPFQRRCHGIVSYLEGDYIAARKELEEALQIMERTRHIPYREGHIAVAKGYLCLVVARLGDLEGAKKNFLDAKEYLVATEEEDLLKECRQATGLS